ncbi:MAG: TIGR04086 family membrane protein [Lachnospirales bacterium]
MSDFKNSPITALLKATLVSYGITMVVFIIYTLLITYSNISESYVSPLALIVTAICCVVSGFVTAKTAGKRGIIWGIASGGVYMAIMFSLGICTIPTFELNQKFVISLILALIGGGIGGIFGVNKK